MNRFRNFMYGRYGMDKLNNIMLAATVILSFSGSIAHSSLLVGLSYLPIIYGLYRALSKDIYKRTEENRKVMGQIHKLTSRFKDGKTYRYYKCPSCKQTIRVPKGKGKICITCPKCRTEFEKRT